MALPVAQQQVLDLATRLNSAEFSEFFDLSEVMAFCQVESAFRPRAYRYEPGLGEGSYGLMQVLASTARDMAGVTDPETMYDPEIGLRVGMKVAQKYWEILGDRLHRDPTLEEWSASYNEGIGGLIRDEADGRIDLGYPKIWESARLHWASLLGPSSPPVTSVPATGTNGVTNPISLIVQAQTLLGVSPDGDPGPVTREALRQWRSTHPAQGTS